MEESASPRSFVRAVCTLLAAAALGGLLFTLLQRCPCPLSDASHAAEMGAATSGPAPDASAASAATAQLSQAFRSAARKVLPAVVVIKAKTTVWREIPHGHPGLRGHVPWRGPWDDEDDEAGPPLETEDGDRNIGSGFVIHPSGIVMTNRHVVEEVDRAGDLIVELPDGRRLNVLRVEADRHQDVAVLKVETQGPLPAAALGDSDALEIGDWVLAVGSPFGLEQTVSAGIISAKGRPVEDSPRARMLQTDAAINPGSSGGPLVGLDGRVVGIATAIASEDGGYQGIGFAVPVNAAKRVAGRLVPDAASRPPAQITTPGRAR